MFGFLSAVYTTGKFVCLNFVYFGIRSSTHTQINGVTFICDINKMCWHDTLLCPYRHSLTHYACDWFFIVKFLTKNCTIACIYTPTAWYRNIYAVVMVVVKVEAW